jgi:BMFP domain-containing protein YqiC
LEGIRIKLLVAQIFSILSLTAWLGLFLYYMFIFAMASTLIALSPFGGLFSGYLMSTAITYGVVFLILMGVSAIVVKRIHDMYNAANGGNIGRLKQLNSFVWSIIALIFSGVVPGVMLLLAQGPIDDLEGESSKQQQKQPNAVDSLIKLKSLLDSGTITESEFKAQKERLLYGEPKNVSVEKRLKELESLLGAGDLTPQQYTTRRKEIIVNEVEDVEAVGVPLDDFDRLLKLKSLLDSGVITREEFDAQKAKLLPRKAEAASVEEKLKNLKMLQVD